MKVRNERARSIWAALGLAACPVPEHEAMLRGVEKGAELRLTDGRLLSMPGIEIEDAAASAAALKEWTGDGSLRIALLSEAPDRWGRLPAVAAAKSAPKGVFLAEELILAGLAVYRPDRMAAPCRATLLAAEIKARALGKGIWRLKSVLPAERTDALRAAPPGLTLIEGKVASARRVRDRLYLNFGESAEYGVSVTFSGSHLALKKSTGLSEEELAGRKIRIRGLLEKRFGLSMEISSADAVELAEESF